VGGAQVSYVASSVKSKVWNGGAAASCLGTVFVTTYQVIFVSDDLQTKSRSSSARHYSVRAQRDHYSTPPLPNMETDPFIPTLPFSFRWWCRRFG
jgi:hypothetical protein